MTRLATITLFLVLCVAAIRAQDKTSLPTAKLQTEVERIVYPPILVAARIQGDVRLRQRPDTIVLLSGPPLLAPTAVESLKRLGSLSESGDMEVVFHFTVIETKFLASTTRVQRGDAFDRLILRLFRLKTERIIEKDECIPDFKPANRIDATKTPLEIRVYGSARCYHA